MGLCDPKEVRKGKPWYMQVNEPGFMKTPPPGTCPHGRLACQFCYPRNKK